ncbi:MAG: transporter [Stygiobacter sp. RIFOXYC12_FULL_38_8]|nr:MAG: transporter [Stygiobacter sp. GWC2_38_9]OGU83758.1 MAG: transporter [Stygiobacter sp. RIFOXYA12_FULL_38_9]OGV07724.1 MAG: transporter [Stygiobacter sp. RIFOXYB2_FULL_37_11]OGV12727.1 MAG: transporter [Stygiobacter sp. RIFOXYC2_FULL_38_25]OGV17620.1 MAG: transporter [Stygiobacter sp. RIFOXYA2_FULL_38_8]OGV26985.1 MAG: transporter [Stygiobacter sp. RIFOXYC12_FULL_38_8]OGV82016.1 MAG: transporter [Stygiobacter sp. GWF2_38_21]RJQ58541.1 MAG: TolC family protein [Stygiobacter sp.]
MKRLKLIMVIGLVAMPIIAQSKLTLNECYDKARANYPLIKQKEYIAKTKEYNVSNVWKGYLPQITISGQATYQSDVTSLPIALPGMKIESLTQDQYKAIADVSQIIYDGGIMSAQANVQRASADIDEQKLEVELLKVKERVNQIYFGILLIDEQLTQTELIKKDLYASLNKLNAALANGTATKPNVDILKAELLKTEQREIEIKSSRKAFVEMLGLLINQRLNEEAKLELPQTQSITESNEINRPEVKLYSSQENLIENQSGLTLAKILPKASLFFQGGYGKPTLNMLKNNFDWFYIAGARLTWAMSNLYTYGNESEVIALNKKSVEAQKETFLLNTNLSLKQQSNELEKLNSLIKVDKQIIEIRTSVKESAKSQLENGVITSNDFIRELNAEDQAKQNLAIHTIQLLLAQQNYKLTTGN